MVLVIGFRTATIKAAINGLSKSEKMKPAMKLPPFLRDHMPTISENMIQR